MNPEKIIIAAVSENNVIGKDGDIPWHYPEDLKHFKKKTTGHSVIMGRKTYFSLPDEFRPLTERKNIVLSRSDPEVPEEVTVAENLEQAWKKAAQFSDKAFVIGGAGVYKQTLHKVDKMIITEIKKEVEGDTYFPDWDRENWKETKREEREELDFVTYIRK